MTLQTALMREDADKKVIASKNANGSYSACEFVNHPPPSGIERWLPTISDNREWATEEEAIEEFKKVLNSLPTAKEILSSSPKAG